MTKLVEMEKKITKLMI